MIAFHFEGLGEGLGLTADERRWTQMNADECRRREMGFEFRVSGSEFRETPDGADGCLGSPSVQH